MNKEQFARAVEIETELNDIQNELDGWCQLVSNQKRDSVLCNIKGFVLTLDEDEFIGLSALCMSRLELSAKALKEEFAKL